MVGKAEVIDDTKAFILDELIDDPDLTLGADTALLSGGLITSFDLVSLVAFIERRFDVQVPNAKMNREHLDTLARIAALVAMLRGDGTTETSAQPAPAYRSPFFPSFMRAPVAVAITMVGAFFAADRYVAPRLPEMADSAGVLDHELLGSANFAHAITVHPIATDHASADTLRIAFLGHSGVEGANVPVALPKLPARVQRYLSDAGFHARVYNLGFWWSNRLEYDAEMVEVALPYAPDVFIIGIDPTYMRSVSSSGELSPPVRNHVLLEHFAANFADVKYSAKDAARVLAFQRVAQVYAASEGILKMSALLQTGSTVQRAVWSLVPHSDADFRARLYTQASKEETEALGGDRTKSYVFDPSSVAFLERIVGRAASRGARVVLVELPEARVEDQPWLFGGEGYSEYLDGVAAVAQRTGAGLVDARKVVPLDEYNNSWAHWTVAGNDVLASFLAAQLAKILAR